MWPQAAALAVVDSESALRQLRRVFALGSDWQGCFCTQQQNQVINLSEDEHFASPALPQAGLLLTHTDKYFTYAKKI